MIDEAKRLFEQYIRRRVLLNDHLIEPAFYMVVGAILTKNSVSYDFQGKTRMMRVHLFVIQASRSGKSELFKACRDLAIAAGVPADHISHATDAALVGTIDQDEEEFDGLLSNLHLLTWDEGGELLTANPHAERQMNILQQAMDTGEIVRPMAKGVIDIVTECTIGMGTYLTADVQPTAMHRGLFQRALVSYKLITSHERLEFIRQQHRLAAHTSEDTSKDMRDFAKLFKDLGKSTVRISPDALEAFNKDFLAPYVEREMQGYADKKQDILDSFLGTQTILHSVAAIHARLNLRNTVEVEDLKEGFRLYQRHIESVKAMLDHIGKLHDDATKHRVAIVRHVLNNQKYLTKTVLVQRLLQHPRWDLGRDRTAEYLEELASTDVLNISRGHPNNEVRFSM